MCLWATQNKRRQDPPVQFCGGNVLKWCAMASFCRDSRGVRHTWKGCSSSSSNLEHNKASNSSGSFFESDWKRSFSATPGTQTPVFSLFFLYYILEHVFRFTKEFPPSGESPLRGYVQPLSFPGSDIVSRADRNFHWHQTPGTQECEQTVPWTTWRGRGQHRVKRHTWNLRSGERKGGGKSIIDWNERHKTERPVWAASSRNNKSGSEQNSKKLFLLHLQHSRPEVTTKTSDKTPLQTMSGTKPEPCTHSQAGRPNFESHHVNIRNDKWDDQNHLIPTEFAFSSCRVAATLWTWNWFHLKRNTELVWNLEARTRSETEIETLHGFPPRHRQSDAFFVHCFERVMFLKNREK